MKKNITILSLMFIQMSWAQVVSENNYNTSIDLYPKSPEAYSFAKFIDIPAGNATGVAHFNIPIYTIELDNLKIPIQLDYSTAGIKVDEISSRLGLGWNLNAGPAITSQIVGQKDMDYSNKIVRPDNFNPTVDLENFNIALGITSNELDYKPDIYTYSIGDISGKFILDNSMKNGISIPYEPIKIFKEDQNIILIDDKGNTYYFIKNFSSLNLNSCDNSHTGDINKYNDTYRLQKIITTKNNLIEYEYEYNVKAEYVTGFSEQQVTHQVYALNGSQQNIPAGPLPKFCIFYSKSNEPILKKIKSVNNSIEFKYNLDNSNKNREDLPGEAILEEILVKNINNDIIKHFKLNQNVNYFKSNIIDLNSELKNQFLNIENLLIGIDKRLKLEEVKNELTGEKYKFEYYENAPLINRLSFAQDYFGVYNGKLGQKSSIAKTALFNKSLNKRNTYDIIPGTIFGAADKKSNFEFAKIGNLKRIIYPTGGSIDIEYEPDKYKSKIESQYNDFVDNSITLSTYEQSIDFDMNPESINIHNLRLYFSGDNDNGSSQADRNNCTLNIIDRETNSRLVNNLNQYTSNTFFSYDGENFKGKKLKMTLKKGYDIYTDKDINCNAKLEWTEENSYKKDVVEIGTLRIKRITTNNLKQIFSKNYIYTNPIDKEESAQVYGERYFTPYYVKNYVPNIPSSSSGLQRVFTNNPGWQINTVKGKSISYGYVTEVYEDILNSNNNYSKINKYETLGEFHDFDGTKLLNFKYPLKTDNLQIGNLLQEVLQNNKKETVNVINYTYNKDIYFNKFSSSYSDLDKNTIYYGLNVVRDARIVESPSNIFLFEFFNINNSWNQLKSINRNDYFSNGTVVSTTENLFSPTYKHLNPVSTTVKNSKGDDITTEYQYPSDLVSGYEQSPIMQEMVNRNMIATPVITRSKNGSTVLSEQRNLYNYFSGTNGTLILPEFVYQKKGSMSAIANIADRKITYNSYDIQGNLTQYTLENGIPVSIIWGYGGQYPVAKLEGVALSQINAATITTLNTKTTDAELLAEITALRTAHKDAMVTGYVYKPLVGVTQIIQPNGVTEKYNYDTSNRLQSIVNDKGEVLKSFEYNYKN